MHLSTNAQMELCEAVANKICELAKRQGKVLEPEKVFAMIFDGDYCDIFNDLLDEF